MKKIIVVASKDRKIEAISMPWFALYEESGLNGYSVVMLNGGLEKINTPDNTGVIILRSFIAKSDRVKEDQKYIVGLRFHGFGDMVTIDVISLDKEMHKDIALEHIKRCGWQTFEQVFPGLEGKIGAFQETMHAPFAVTGGHLKVSEQNKISFFDTSGDYGKETFFSDSNSIANFVVATCGLEIEETDITKGEEFIADLLEFMDKNKLQNDFYERFIDYAHEKNSLFFKTFSTQQILSLITMKVIDRINKEGGDYIQKMVEEVSGGRLGRYIMLSGVAANIKSQEKEED